MKQRANHPLSKKRRKVSQIEKQSDGKLKITLAQMKNDQVTNDICVDI